MPIMLVDVSQPTRTLLHGSSTEVVPDGKKMKINIPSGATIFNDGPPAGKQWKVVVDITVEELPA